MASDGRLEFDASINKEQIKKDTSTIQKIINKFKKEKVEIKADVKYSAEHNQDFFKENIEDFKMQASEATKALQEAQSKLLELQENGKDSGIASNPTYQKAIEETSALVEKLKNDIATANQGIADNTAWLNERKEIDETIQKIDALKQKMQNFIATGGNTNSTTFKKMQLDLAQAEGNLDRLRNGTDTTNERVDQLRSNWDKVADSTKNASKQMSNGFGSKAPKAINKTSNSLSRLVTMMKFMVIRKMINAIIKSFQDGFQQLSKYSPEVNKSLSSMMSSLSQLKYGFAAAFAPLVSIVAPVVNQICSAINSLLVALSKLFAFLSGKNTFIVAKKQQTDYAKSLSGTSKAAKDAEKSLASFDEINQLNISNNSSSGGGSSINPNDLFETKDVGKPTKFMERMKSLLDDLVKSAKNLKKAFITAWDYAGNGERIMQSLSNMGDSIYKSLKDCTEATVIWSENLNLIPLLSSIANLFESLEPIIADIGNVLSWLYISVILPLATWIIEELLPALNDVLAPLLDTFDAIFNAIAPVLQNLWENILLPLFEYVGSTVIDLLNKLSKSLIENKDDIAEIAKVLSTLLTWILNVLVPFVTLAITNISMLIQQLLITITGVIQGIRKVLDGLIDFITGVFTGDWEKAWNGVKEIFSGIWDIIASIVEGILNGIISGTENAVNFVVDAVNGLSFDIPDWVPIIGGSHFGMNLGHVSFGRVSIPRLATGTVVPPNAGEFAAILGDNKKETEVVSPLSTMKEALIEALQEYGLSREIILQVNGDMGALVRLLKIELSKEEKRKGTKLVTV